MRRAPRSRPSQPSLTAACPARSAMAFGQASVFTPSVPAAWLSVGPLRVARRMDHRASCLPRAGSRVRCVAGPTELAPSYGFGALLAGETASNRRDSEWPDGEVCSRNGRRGAEDWPEAMSELAYLSP